MFINHDAKIGIYFYTAKRFKHFLSFLPNVLYFIKHFRPIYSLFECLAIGHAVVLVTHNEVVPLWPESLEGVDAVAVDVGTEATAHATCSRGTLLVDVGQCEVSVSNVCPHVVISPDGQWHTSRMVLA